MNKKKTGSEYEEKAAAFLQHRGYKIIRKNYYCRQGEIDIIALDGDYLVFVEVKYRRNVHMGTPEGAVDYKKRQRMIVAANDYLVKEWKGKMPDCRFDVVAFRGDMIHYIYNAFECF